MFYVLKSLGRFKRKWVCEINRKFFLNTVCIHNCNTPWKVIFYGTDQMSETTLKALNMNRLSEDSSRIIQDLEVICKKSDCAVRRYATMNKLTIHTWPYDIPPNVYDVGVVVSFGHMIPSTSILACKYGIINGHPSLLPRWRGAAPIFHTILKGDEMTGVTITQVSPNKFDVGHILMQELYAVPKQCTSKKLIEDLSKLAAFMVLKTLSKLPEYIDSSYPQSNEGATLARKIKPQNCCINWVEDTSVDIDRKFRAYTGFFELYTTWKNLKIIIMDIASYEEITVARVSSLVKNSVSPGFCYFHKKRKIIFVKCQNGWSGIKTLSIPKRGKISALDFYNGFLNTFVISTKAVNFGQLPFSTT